MWRYEKWQEPVLAIFKASRDSAETWSYGEWQEPVLATFKASRDSAEMWSYWKWQEPVLAILKASRDRAETWSYGEWQEPVLATWSIRKLLGVARTGSCHFLFNMCVNFHWQELVLAIFKVTPDMLQWWQEPSDNLLSFLSGKYQYLPLFSCKKWQEPWQEPFLNYPQDILWHQLHWYCFSDLEWHL